MPNAAPLPADHREAPPMASEALLHAVAGYAGAVKAQSPVALDLREVSGYTDFFLVCSGGSDRQAKAIHDRIYEGMKKEHGLLPRRVEGATEARWILLDYVDVVVHVFVPEAREFYNLEKLWGDVPRVALED